MDEQKDDRIFIKDIKLLESNFTLISNIYTKKIQNHIDISLDVENEDEKEFNILMKLEFSYKNDKNEDMAIAKIIMAGIFELTNEKPLYFREFCYVNAPAIIYPYIREHISSLTIKAGLPPANLPPFNFVAFGKKYIQEKLKEVKD